MLKSTAIFITSPKTIFLSVFVLLLITFNFLLNESLEKKRHNLGDLLAKQLYQQTLTPDNNVLKASLIKSKGFILEPNLKIAYLLSPKHNVFSYKTYHIRLYYWPAWITQSYLFLILNSVFIGSALWGLYWWNMLFSGFKKSRSTCKPSTTKNNTQSQSTDEFSTFYNKKEQWYSLFIRVRYDCKYSKDLELNLKKLITNRFLACFNASIQLLSPGHLAVTLHNVPVQELDKHTQYIHQFIYIVCKLNYQNTKPENIKVGACSYNRGDNQTMVHQLVKSALSLSIHNKFQHNHRLMAGHSQTHALSDEEIIEEIQKNKFIVFFQPLFEFTSGDILQHEALINMCNNSTNKLLAARYFINSFTSEKYATSLDKMLIKQVKKVLLAESRCLAISINLHPKSWRNSEFWGWLVKQLDSLNATNQLQFEINYYDFFKEKNALSPALQAIHDMHGEIVVGNINSSEDIDKLVNYKQVCGIKLAHELTHRIDKNIQQQKQLKKIVKACLLVNLPVYAVGIETKKELMTLSMLGVSAGQGGYFSEPLEELTQAAFH